MGEREHHSICEPNNGEIQNQGEKSFIGYGEDESFNMLSSARKPKKNNCNADPIKCSNIQEPEKLDSFQKLFESFAEQLDQDSGFKSGDYRENHPLLIILQSFIASHNENYVESRADFERNGLFGAISEEHLTAANSSSNCSPRESLESSLGILNFSELSSFGCESFEGPKSSSVSEVGNTEDDNFCQVEALQHQNKHLREERGRLLEQMSQTDDQNLQLLVDNDDLNKKIQALQDLLDKLKEKEKEHSDLKVNLSSFEEINVRLKLEIAQQEKDRGYLEIRITELNEEIRIAHTEIDELKQQMDELKFEMAFSKSTILKLKEENETISGELEQKTNQLREKEYVVNELLNTTESLKQQKVDLEKELYRAEEEVASLQHAAEEFGRISLVADDNTMMEETLSCSNNNNSFNCSDCANAIPHKETNLFVTLEDKVLCSTPVKSNSAVSKNSLCAEMRDVARLSGESLPTPFCGKHIFPAALYSEVNSSTSGKSRDKRSHTTMETNGDDIDCTFTLKKVPKLSENSSLVEIREIDGKHSFQNTMLNGSFTGASLKSVRSENDVYRILVEEIYNALQEINGRLEKINTETVPVIHPYLDSNCVLSEPVSNPLNPEEPDESLKDQINTELKMLRNQIAKTQAILSYLHSKGKKIPGGISSSFSFISDEDQHKPINKDGAAGMFHSYNSDLLPVQHKSKAFWLKESLRTGSNSPSQKSTPLHKARCLTRSCPNLPSQWSVINRATQTEASMIDTLDTSTKVSSAKERSLDDTHVGDKRNSNEVKTVSPVGLRIRSLSFMKAVTNCDREMPIDKDAFCREKQGYSSRKDDREQKSTDDEYNEKRNNLEDAVSVHGESAVTCGKSAKKGEDYDSKDNQESIEKARKRRRSFSEHNTNYSTAFDLSERENCNSSDPLPMQVTLPSKDSQRKLSIVEKLDSPTIMQPLLTQQVVPPTAQTSTADVLKFPKSSAAFSARAALNEKTKRREFPVGPGRRFLMPDVMETSETESAKDSANGSMESEGADPRAECQSASEKKEGATDEVMQPPPPSNDPYFPSLPDEFLRKLNLERGSIAKPEEFTAQEVEGKFSTLSLAFKTDKFTLAKRLELQKRQRDTAEGNITKEVESMKDALNTLNHLCTDSQMRELIVKLQRHVDIIHQSTSRMSSRAEVYGAVQQEERMNHAYEIMVTYVENLKRLYEKEHNELEDTKRLLIANRLLPDGPNGSSPNGAEAFGSLDDPKRTHRASLSSSGSAKPQSTRRRASVAVFHRPLLEAAKSAIGSLSNLSNLGGAGHGEFRARLYSAVTPLGFHDSRTKLDQAGSSSNSPLSIQSIFNKRSGRHSICGGSVFSNSGTSSGTTASNEDLMAVLDRMKADEDEDEEKDKVQSERRKASIQTVESTPNGSVIKTTEQNQQETNGDVLSIKEKQSTSHVQNVTRTVQSLRSQCQSPVQSPIFPEDNVQDSPTSHLLPIKSWRCHWNLTHITRGLRYGFVSLLLLGALLSLVFTFLPSESTGCSSASSTSRSLQETIEDLFRPYVVLKYFDKPL